VKETFDLDAHHDLISKITDGVLEEGKKWQNRPEIGSRPRSPAMCWSARSGRTAA
jgi:hypothetical protein